MARLARVSALCDGCKSAKAVVYCIQHELPLCGKCDGSIHPTKGSRQKKKIRLPVVNARVAMEPPVSRGPYYGAQTVPAGDMSSHSRISVGNQSSVLVSMAMCDVCDRRPATVYCENEGSTMCKKCDNFAHSGRTTRTHSRKCITKTIAERTISFAGKVPSSTSPDEDAEDADSVVEPPTSPPSSLVIEPEAVNFYALRKPKDESNRVEQYPEESRLTIGSKEQTQRSCTSASAQQMAKRQKLAARGVALDLSKSKRSSRSASDARTGDKFDPPSSGNPSNGNGSNEAKDGKVAEEVLAAKGQPRVSNALKHANVKTTNPQRRTGSNDSNGSRGNGSDAPSSNGNNSGFRINSARGARVNGSESGSNDSKSNGRSSSSGAVSRNQAAANKLGKSGLGSASESKLKRGPHKESEGSEAREGSGSGEGAGGSGGDDPRASRLDVPMAHGERGSSGTSSGGDGSGDSPPGDRSGGSGGEGSGGGSGGAASASGDVRQRYLKVSSFEVGSNQGSGSGDGSGSGEAAGGSGGDGGSGEGSGSGNVSGEGSGSGSGDAAGEGSGEGSILVSGSGEGSGEGSGDGSGEGSGEGSGDGSGEGSGDGSGEGSGEASGDGSPSGSGEDPEMGV
uniref:B box-type domain-containing protein n=2 Tax=Rhodosorus marinus TaxID=101924 RepID=A0A7S3EJ97_9RHOD|mmetsp:Transcript_40414/g.160451  ORF Transcript_40414/g.160451 Transcript_40414/m.160451 type:complete len:623 (+) Transcript_40414:319-2187(+)